MRFSLAAPQSIPVDYNKLISAGWTDWFQTPLLYFCCVFNYPWSSSVHSWVIVCVWGSSQLNNGPGKKYSVFWAHFLFRLLVCHWKVAKKWTVWRVTLLTCFFFFMFLSSGRTEYRAHYQFIMKFVLAWFDFETGFHVSLADFNTLCSQGWLWTSHLQPPCGRMHVPLVWFCTILGVVPGASCTLSEQATLLAKLHLQSHKLVFLS